MAGTQAARLLIANEYWNTDPVRGVRVVRVWVLCRDERANARTVERGIGVPLLSDLPHNDICIDTYSFPLVSVKPIRISLDLAPALFDQLTEWRTRAARQLGRGRVTNADALRVLVRLLSIR